VLLSAIRVSPPANGPAHAGKVIGQDEVTYTYNQVHPIYSLEVDKLFITDGISLFPYLPI
jgi:hypothetical protein